MLLTRRSLLHDAPALLLEVSFMTTTLTTTPPLPKMCSLVSDTEDEDVDKPSLSSLKLVIETTDDEPDEYEHQKDGAGGGRRLNVPNIDGISNI